MFHKPVDVSSLVKMRAQIVYTEVILTRIQFFFCGKILIIVKLQVHYLQILVNAEVFDPKSGNVSTTNVFHYTYKMEDEAPQV